jgi:hypothetical protein
MTQQKPKSNGNAMNSNAIGLAVLVGFCALALWGWMPKGDTQEQAVRTPTSDLTARLETSQDTMANLIEVTTDRPLFHSTRTPPIAPEAPVAPVAPEATLTLVGILGADGEKVALLRISTSPQIYRLQDGARLGDWEIVKIGDATIDVRKDDGTTDRLVIGQ